MHHVSCHAGSHDAGGKAGRAGCPLPCTKYIGNRAFDRLLHRKHGGIERDLLLKRPADDCPFAAADRTLNAQRACREREEDVLFQLWVYRRGEHFDHGGFDVLLKLLIPTACFYPSGKLVVEEEACDQARLTLRGCAAVVENRNRNLIGVETTEGVQPDVEFLSIEGLPPFEQGSKFAAMQLSQPLPWGV